MTAVLQFIDVSKRFGEHRVLDGVSLTVDKGRVHFILGMSGAGKSVLIKQAVGLMRPDQGDIIFQGKSLIGLSEDDFLPVRARCQLIFQQATLFDQLTVVENIAMPLRKRFGLARGEAQAQAEVALGRVHASHLAERLPTALGAGLLKRVAIARALALKPDVLLYDEPTTSLDPVAARRTDRLVAAMAHDYGITSLVVSHDLISVAAIAERVSFLHQGKIHFDGTAQQFFATPDPFLRDFIEKSKPLATE